MFKHFFTTLQPMGSPWTTNLYGNLVSISQAKYEPQASRPADIGMASVALAHVPTSCQENAQSCSIHVQYHGCGGGGTTKRDAASLYWVEINYIAETNGIIVLYPQAVAASYQRWVNPNGCWDWKGDYGSSKFDTHSGAQMNTVLAMIS